MNLTIPGSTWGDVFVDGPNRIGCVYDLGIDVIVDFYSVENGILKKRDSIHFDFTEKVLFARGDRNNLGHILVMGQGASSGKFRLKSRGGNYEPPIPQTTFGTHVCDLQPFGNSFHYVVQNGPKTYYDSLVARTFPITELPEGTSQGIIQLLGNDIHWSDIWRQAVPQMLFPFIEGGVAVGEGATDPAHIQAFELGEQKNILWGVAERPRCCYDSFSNLFVVASRSGSGVSFNFYHKPLPNLSVEPEPGPDPNPDPKPEPVPTMRIPEKVVATIDRYHDKFPIPTTSKHDIGQWTIKLNEQVAFEHPNDGYGCKRADPGRPVSDDVLAQKSGDNLIGWDLVIGAGTTQPQANWHKADSIDLNGQIFIGPLGNLDDGARFVPQNHLSGIPIPGPGPGPTPNPDNCTPIVPGHNEIAASLNALRNFCKSYIAPPHALPEYANNKPYVNDQIDQNGLYIADGLLYFMLSDTGNWAKILMNPTDKRSWDEKRRDADAALISYMKKRVGDNS